MQFDEFSQYLERQDGLVTRKQALNHVTRHQLSGMIEKGLVRRVEPSVFAWIGFPHSWRQRVRAVLLSHPSAVLSHRAAARLWDVAAYPVSRVEVTVPRGRQLRVESATVHNSSLLIDHFVASKESLAVTTPTRTIIDLSAVASPSALQRSIDRALDLGLLNIPALVWDLDLLSARGRRRTTVLREVLEHYDATADRQESTMERRALAVLRGYGLPEPAAQHPILVNGRRYRADFAYPHQRLAIEIDGLAFHHNSEAFHSDRVRDLDFHAAGYTVFRFTSRSLDQLGPRVATFLNRPNRTLSA